MRQHRAVRTRHAARGALVLAAALAACPGASSQAQPAAAQPGARISGQAATSALFDQASYWASQNQPERALQALERVLAVEPNNVDALSAAVEAAAQASQAGAAQRHLATLRRAAPGDERTQRAEEQVQLLSQDGQTLTTARQLAAAGRQAEAVQRYRQLARGGRIPAIIASEYYQVLAAASEAGYREAVTELRQRVAAAPGDSRLALTLAQLLTYREDTRSDGIDRMEALAQRPGMRETVRGAWRSALLWSGEDAETAVRIDAYSRVYGALDPELTSKRRQASEAGGLSVGQRSRLSGWQEIERGRLNDAERAFAESIEADSEDAEALVGMAIVRKMQNRLPDARQFFARAVAAAPDRREEFERMTGDLSGRFAGGTGGALSASARAWQLMQRGDMRRAEELARRAAQGRGEERLQGELIVGQIALQRSDYAAAEQRFRSVLALRPRQNDALVGLYLALQGLGRFAEADALQQEMRFAIPPGMNAARAALMLESARRLDHPEQAVEQLRAARRLDPSDPWLTVDLVRRLKSRGDVEEARSFERELEQRTDAQSSMAAAILAFDDERFGDVVALFERVPARLRNAEMTRLSAQARREFEVRQMEDQAREGRLGATTRLEQMASQRDPAGLMGPAVVRAFGRLEDPARAERAARLAYAANPNMDAQARIALAAALVEARRPDVARLLTQQLIRDPRLSAEQRRELETVMDFEATARADLFLVDNRQADARAELEAMAARRGGELTSGGNVSLARLLVAQGRPREARVIVEQLLERNPRDLEARQALVDVAIAERDWDRAQAALVEGAFFHPNDLRMTLAEARLRRARGDQLGTLRLMERAAARRLAELRADGEVAMAGSAARAMSPTGGMQQAQRLHDPLTSQIAQELIRARDDASMWAQGGVNIQNRGGVAGISRITNVTVPTEVSVPAPAIGGRLTVGVDTVVLRSGNMSTDFNTTQLFGTNPVFADPAFVQPAFTRGRSGVEGAAIRATYIRPNLRVEVGSTPLGFPNPTWTGVFEVVPQLTDRLRLRATAERAPITDSILSYAGYRQAGGPFWGGVMRTGGRLQLEYAPTDRIGFYGGGGAYALDGSNVVRNTRYEAGVGGFYTVLRQPGQSVTIGVDLRYLGHDRNASGFTFGHGGYFSPSRSFTASLQGEYRAQWGDWTFRGIGSVGYQNFRVSSAPVFPTNPGYQAQIEQLAALAPDVFRARLPSSRSAGIAGSLFANLEYAATPNLRLGLAGRYEKAGDYEDTVGFFYLRYRFDQPRRDLAPLFNAFPARAPQPNVNDPQVGFFQNGAPELVRLPGGAARPVW